MEISANKIFPSKSSGHLDTIFSRVFFPLIMILMQSDLENFVEIYLKGRPPVFTTQKNPLNFLSEDPTSHVLYLKIPTKSFLKGLSIPLTLFSEFYNLDITFTSTIFSFPEFSKRRRRDWKQSRFSSSQDLHESKVLGLDSEKQFVAQRGTARVQWDVET